LQGRAEDKGTPALRNEGIESLNKSEMRNAKRGIFRTAHFALIVSDLIFHALTKGPPP